MKNTMIYKLIWLFVILFSCANAWEVNTHRAIDREALAIVSNLEQFMDDTQLDKTESFENKYDHYLGYETTYFNYITYNEEDNDMVYNPAMSEISFQFIEHNYKDLIEAGSILEDATWNVATFWGGNGRFFNHFLNPQDNNSGFIAGINALTWANGVVTNLYSYKKARYYMKQAFINSTVEERKLNTARVKGQVIMITKERNSKIVKAYAQGYSQHTIAKVLGLSQPVVFGVIKRSRE